MKEIIIFSDFACPFSYIGFSIMNRLRIDRQDIEFYFLPYVLNPELSLEGGDLGDDLDEETINQGFERVELLGSEYKLNYNNKRKIFNTNRLHLASQYAQEMGKFFSFAEIAFKYIFEYGYNVADIKTINKIGFKIGLDINEMNEKIDSGEYDDTFEISKLMSETYKVDSVPTFIVDKEKKSTELKSYEIFIQDLLK